MFGFGGNSGASGPAGPGETVRLEGFSETLRGTRTWLVGSGKSLRSLVVGRMTGLDAEVTHRGRKVLVIQGTEVPKWIWTLRWDAVFRIRETVDLRLAVTVLQNLPKPVRVVWWGSEPAAAVMTALAAVKELTIFGASGVAPRASSEWNCIIWASDVPYTEIEAGVLAHMGAQGNLRAVHKELAANEVALVWSSIGETDKRGALYWTDPREGVPEGTDAMDPAEAAEMLRLLADSLESGGKRST